MSALEGAKGTLQQEGNVAITTTPIEIDDDGEDLEDGEIDDDEDDDDVVITKVEQKLPTTNTKKEQHSSRDKSKVLETIDLIKDASKASAIQQHLQASSNSNKKSFVTEDDHAINIEKALANVLKKKGLQPIFPKLESRHMDEVIKDIDLPSNHPQSRSSRRRKRRKEQKDKDRDRKDKKKHRYESPERSGSPNKLAGPPPLEDENDMDEYEMLNVRGGSPPPVTSQPSFNMHQNYNDVPYGTGDESMESSYDSYDSEEDRPNEGERRRKKHDRKIKKKRDRKDKRGRQGSDDEKRSVPTIWELCKFYLLERCAKRNHCSYMHAEFPCKYYYLGMECDSGDDCKFLHGEPLNGQLRNILLKHLETAPKEILGTFKRITRENALQSMSRRHEKLCRQYNVQNTWPTLQQLLHTYGRRNANGTLPEGVLIEAENGSPSPSSSQTNTKTGTAPAQGQQNPLQQNKSSTGSSSKSEIPSLLDMVIAPPLDDDDDEDVESNESLKLKPEQSVKSRKSRWTTDTTLQQQQQPSQQSRVKSKDKDKDKDKDKSKDKNSYMDLKNLQGILNQKYYDKLTEIGIKNLQEVKELRVGELDELGLSMDEVKEIYTIIEKLQTNHDLANDTSNINQEMPVPGDSLNENAPNRDVDMRFIPRLTTTALNTTTTTSFTTAASVSSSSNTFGSHLSHDNIDEPFISNNSNSDSSSALPTLDISQYLKEANLSFDRADMDDEMDDEQLIIDDGNLDKDDLGLSISVKKDSSEKKAANKIEQNLLSTQMEVPELAATLKNPFKSLYGSFGTNKDEINSHFSFGEKKTSIRNPFLNYSSNENDENNGEKKSSSAARAYLYQDQDFIAKYSRIQSRSRSRSRSHSGSRSRSQTPTRSRSVTPEHSQSSNEDGDGVGGGAGGVNENEAVPKIIEYKRKTIYDYTFEDADEDEKQSKSEKDKDMRFIHGRSFGDTNGSGDIDFRLPFQPITNYVPATEIDCSVTSHQPIDYKVYTIMVPNPSYSQLRNNFKTSTDTTDPRLRRILGLPELNSSKSTSSSSSTSASSKRSSRKISVTIASPESEDNQKYYIPPGKSSSSSGSGSSEQSRSISSNVGSGIPHTSSSSSSNTSSTLASTTNSCDPRRLDPRRAAASAAGVSNQVKPSMGSPLQNSSSIAGGSTNPPVSSNSAIVEIRTLLQKSEWYKNLNSKFKIMVNQQLALVSTELKKFHQDSSPNKIFDMSFIVNNNVLQQILTNLGIYIDDNGDVAHIDNDQDDPSSSKGSNLQGGGVGGGGNGANSGNNIQLPNLSQPPPNTQNRQMDFLRAPPPNMCSPMMSGGNQQNSMSSNVGGSGNGNSGNVSGGGGGGNNNNSMGPQLMQALGIPGGQGGPPNGPRNPLNPFASNIPSARPSLLGLPPGVVNPFMGLSPNFVNGGVPPAAAAAAANMLAAAAAFNNFAPGSLNIQPRNFNHQQQRSRRSKKI